jgi:hypothetical protein
LGIEVDSAVTRSWNRLSNGQLVSAVAAAKFSVLLTRDQLFGGAAAGALRTYPDFCVVRVTLPQLRANLFLSAFRAAWQAAQIIPVPGRMIEWSAP